MTTEQSSPGAVPICLAAMGCLCAGHARGDDASAACDTREESDLPKINCDGCGEPMSIGYCFDCNQEDVAAIEEPPPNANTAKVVREYATRRKALGLLSIDGYDAIMLMADDLEAIHA